MTGTGIDPLRRLRTTVAAAVAVAAALIGPAAEDVKARTLLKNICRVKGQEENSLQGLGLVVGLRGTGDSGDYLPTMRALARAMELMGNPLSRPDLRGRGGLAELKNTKNVALVWVTATVPSAGARRGDKIDCYVSAIGAKSLAGGRLMFAALQGPRTDDPQIYAVAEGRVHLDAPDHSTEGKVHQGCRLEEDFFNAFEKDGKITLVLDKNHADFQIAADVAEMINDQMKYQSQDQSLSMARALDPANILVTIPQEYVADPVLFVAQILSLPILEPQTDARVVINERAGSIVIGGDVEIGSAVVTHKNIVVETGRSSLNGAFVSVDPSQRGSTRLESLVEALNAVKVPNEDVIEIIKGLERNGKLHGKLIVE